MIPLLITPDLRQSCPACFPYGPALDPRSTVSTGATLRADYRCGCGAEWHAFWDGSPWPLALSPLGRAA